MTDITKFIDKDGIEHKVAIAGVEGLQEAIDQETADLTVERTRAVAAEEAEETRAKGVESVLKDKLGSLKVSDITDFPESMPASDVYDWAKAETKPTYTASEVGAAASGHTHTVSKITNFGDGVISAVAIPVAVSSVYDLGKQSEDYGLYLLMNGKGKDQPLDALVTTTGSDELLFPTDVASRAIPDGGSVLFSATRAANAVGDKFMYIHILDIYAK